MALLIPPTCKNVSSQEGGEGRKERRWGGRKGEGEGREGMCVNKNHLFRFLRLHDVALCLLITVMITTTTIDMAIIATLVTTPMTIASVEECPDDTVGMDDTV